MSVTRFLILLAQLMSSDLGTACTTAFWGTNAHGEQVITANHCDTTRSWKMGAYDSSVLLGAGKAGNYTESDVDGITMTSSLQRSPTMYWGGGIIWRIMWWLYMVLQESR